MATGYTCGIVDGTTKTFKEFAFKCIRAFGAAAHMRDEPISKPFKLQTVSTSTIEWDCNIEHDKEELERYSVELESIKENPSAYVAEVRSKLKKSLIEDAARAWKSYNDDLKRVTDNNNWVTTLTKSL